MASIWGFAIGNISGTIYFFFFQLIGFLLSSLFLSKKNFITRILCGSVLGSVLLQWIPALFAFIFQFSVKAHIAAALFCTFAAAILFYLKKPQENLFSFPLDHLKALTKKHWIFLLLCSITFVLFCIMLFSHTLLPKEDGLHTGQCTYGDINLHLSIITNLARQQTFPPYYSISPGNKLSYPFLCDSISSSIYLFGASLRYAYMLPMYFAFLQVMTGFYCFAYAWLKKAAKASLAWFFFFYNGGLGFVYFIDWSSNRIYQFKNIFTEYYQTPTNLIDNNIRWVNVIVDMLLPQRATLFGYAVLFTCIWLLYRSVFLREHDLFPFAAVLTASLPMIHTHSFLAMALLSAAWLLADLYPKVNFPFKLRYPGKLLFAGFLILMLLIQLFNRQKGAVDGTCFLIICLIGLGIFFLSGMGFMIRHIRKNGMKKLISTWGLYLFLILLLSLPQLFYWTFGQASHTGFLTGRFNWGNQGDGFLWFYIKNWGLILLLFIPAVFYGKKKNLAVTGAGFLIWFVMELICFSPNPYDNNKLLYIAFVFFCCISADYGYELYQSIKRVKGIRLWSMVFLFFSGISAVLSIGREMVSDYTLYSSSHIEAAIYVDQNTSADATILTNDRHVNEITALSGRNIVSGAPNFLWTHGIYDQPRVDDVKYMYEFPAFSIELFEKYQVDYIMISSWERSSYQIDETVYDALFECVFTSSEVKLYKTGL